jgi:hypothetical protein
MPDMSRKAARRRKQAAERAKRYRARKKDAGSEVFHEFEETPPPPPKRLCPKCHEYEIHPQIGYCGACWSLLPTCKRCHSRKVTTERTGPGELMCDPCWHLEPISIYDLIEKEPPPTPEPPQAPITPVDVRQEIEVKAQAGGCTLPEFNVFQAAYEATATKTGDWNAAEGMRWEGELSQREALVEKMKRDARRRAGSQEYERG